MMKEKFFFKGLCVVALSFALAACQLPPVDTGRGHMFALSPAPAARVVQASLPLDLTVGLPTAPDVLDTYRVALLRSGRTWDYYAGARWADFLPGMVQSDLVKTFASAGVFKTVMPDETGVFGGVMLKPDIRAFEAFYQAAGQAPVVHVRIVAALVTDVTRKPLAAFSAQADSRASADSLPAVQAAFSKAYRAATTSLVRQLAAAAKADGQAWEKAVQE